MKWTRRSSCAQECPGIGNTLTQSERDEQVAKTLEVPHTLSGYAPAPEQDRAADDELARRLGSST